MRKYYNKFSDYLVERYGEKVWKISLDAGLSCPNCQKDGKEGCIFCRNDSFSRGGSRAQKSISQQMHEGITLAKKRLKIGKYLAYFQTSTNTFAPVNQLEKLYNEAITIENVVAISIATRPDCLPPQVIELIKNLTKKVDVWIELGLQSSRNETLERIHRGHFFEDYEDAVEKLHQLDVRICTHVMIGLPGESKDEVIETARQITKNGTDEVKIHPLLILQDTPLASLYKSGHVQPLAFNDYVALAVDFMEVLSPTTVIQRLTAESPKELLIEPQWSLNKLRVLNAIDAEFEKRGTRQGAKFL